MTADRRVAEAIGEILGDLQLLGRENQLAGDIGLIIGLTRRGVEKSFYTAYRRLGVRTRVQAVLRARELGLLGPQTRSRWIEPEKRQFKAPS
jgi:hypothetical protein